MHLQTTIDLKNTLLKANEKSWHRILQRLTAKEKQQLFTLLQVSQDQLPLEFNYLNQSNYLTLVEYPDGWQLNMEWRSTEFHKVSHDLYNTQTDAYNAYLLGLVTWNELTESPLATQTRVNIEDRDLSCFPQ